MFTIEDLFHFLHQLAAIICLGGILAINVVQVRIGTGNDRAAQASLLRQSGLYGRAIITPAAADYLSQSLAMRRRLGWPAGEAMALENLGVVFFGLGRLDLAAQHHAQAVAIHRRLAAPRLRPGRAMVLASSITVWAGSTTPSRCSPRRAPCSARPVIASSSGIECALGDAYRDLGDQLKALRHAETALLIAREVDDRTLEGYALAALASTHLTSGDLGRAVGGHHERALELARDIGDRYLEIDVMARLACDHLRVGQLGIAADLAGQALTTARMGGYRLLEGQAATVLAAALLRRGEPEAAIDQVKQALDIHAETGHRLGQAQAHLIAARALRGTGSDAEASMHESAAHELFAKIGTDPGPTAAAFFCGDAPDDGFSPRLSRLVEPEP